MGSVKSISGATLRVNVTVNSSEKLGHARLFSRAGLGGYVVTSATHHILMSNAALQA